LKLVVKQGAVALGFCYRVGGQSIRHSYTLTIWCGCSLFIFFFVTWFHAHTRVRWVALVIGEFLLGYIRVDPLGLIYLVIFPFELFLGQVLCPPSLCITLFYLLYLLFGFKKKCKNI